MLLESLTLQELFLASPRKLDIYFYTSSDTKYLHARRLMELAGISLRHYRESQAPYEEDYQLGQREIFRRAIARIKRLLGINSIFFLEDTSIRIEALSTEEADFPGLSAKEWFGSTAFSDLDKTLKSIGNDRRARVLSDIALHVPGLKDPVFFHGESTGVIADTEPSFVGDPRYPWLGPDSFNAWIVPHGATSRLGEMTFEESLKFDFRARSIEGLVARLAEYSAVLNLSSSSYTVSRKQSVAPTLFPEVNQITLVVGKTCAGKTTFGEIARTKHQCSFIEASSVVKMLAIQRGIDEGTPYARARELLREQGADVVARFVVSNCIDDESRGTVIGGFRTIEEIQYVKSVFPRARTIFIDSTERTRFERQIKRGRDGDVESISDFRKKDSEQSTFGLLNIAESICDYSLTNEGSLDEYADSVAAIIEGDLNVRNVRNLGSARSAALKSRVVRSLTVLESSGKPLTSIEISDLMSKETSTSDRKSPSPRHVNWILREVPELCRRIEIRGDPLRYQITESGRAYLAAIRALLGIDA